MPPGRKPPDGTCRSAALPYFLWIFFGSLHPGSPNPDSATLFDIHRLFADFQSQRRKRKIEATLKLSALISASPPSIFSENRGAQPPVEKYLRNELSRTDS